MVLYGDDGSSELYEGARTFKAMDYFLKEQLRAGLTPVEDEL